MQVTAESIAAVMQLEPLPHSFAELEERIAQGLPKQALKASIDHLCLGTEARNALLYKIVPEATYKRRKSALSLEESERAERLARVIATAEYVWGDSHDAQQFLCTVHPLLQGRLPLDVALTELGARRVEMLLWRLFYGAAA